MLNNDILVMQGRRFSVIPGNLEMSGNLAKVMVLTVNAQSPGRVRRFFCGRGKFDCVSSRK